MLLVPYYLPFFRPTWTLGCWRPSYTRWRTTTGTRCTWTTCPSGASSARSTRRGRTSTSGPTRSLRSAGTATRSSTSTSPAREGPSCTSPLRNWSSLMRLVQLWSPHFVLDQMLFSRWCGRSQTYSLRIASTNILTPTFSNTGSTGSPSSTASWWWDRSPFEGSKSIFQRWSSWWAWSPWSWCAH